MSRQLSPQTIELVKASVPALAAHGSEITKRMYAKLFEDEHIKNLFNHANQGEGGSQVHALAAAILGYAQNIENLAVLTPVVERIAHKHIGYDILPEHYPYVARALLAAISDVLGEAATPEILDAWGEAYWFLADILKGREANLRDAIESQSGGWNGWRMFTITEKLPESEVVTSFILRPTDGGKVIMHRPGQYLTLRLIVNGDQVKTELLDLLWAKRRILSDFGQARGKRRWWVKIPARRSPCWHRSGGDASSWRLLPAR